MKVCEVCGSPEHPSWRAHVFRKVEDKKEAAKQLRVPAPELRAGQGVHPGSPDRSQDEASKPSVVRTSRTLNRRSREAYNRYQRVLMALRRTGKAIEKGKACAWPRRV